VGMGGQRRAPVVVAHRRAGAHYIGGWVGPRTGLDGYGISRPQRD
jgi:hypothetical protein